MQNLAIRNFANQANLLVPDTANRRVLLPAIIGIAIGSCLVPKLGEELHPMTVFSDNYLINVQRAVSKINEELLIDVKTACDSACSMYMVRHRILNGMVPTKSVSPEYDILSVMLGLSTVFPLETYEALKAIGLSAATLFTTANLLIDELKRSNFIAL